MDLRFVGSTRMGKLSYKLELRHPLMLLFELFPVLTHWNPIQFYKTALIAAIRCQ